MEEEYLPDATEAGFGIGFTSRGKLDSLPDKTTGIVLLHNLHHPSSPKRTHSSSHGRHSFWFSHKRQPKGSLEPSLHRPISQ